MRTLICADIHANLEALDAVLGLARRQGIGKLIVLGDLVGYGASPCEVLQRLQAWEGELVLLRGNHDKVIAGLEDASGFNDVARASVAWTRLQLDDEQLEFLRDLPVGPIELKGLGTMCHGAPFDEDTYLFTADDARLAFVASESSPIFFGHTHHACLFMERGERVGAYVVQGDSGQVELEPGTRYLINPGSVGQPRDGDPRAACIVFDPDQQAVDWQRVEYSLADAQRRIHDAGLPGVLADRLAVGG